MMLRTITLLGLIGCASAATAVPVTYTDSIDITPDRLMGLADGPYSFTHDINDNGFDAAADTLLSVMLTLDVIDDGDVDYTTYRTVRVTTWCGRHSRWGSYHCHYDYRRYVDTPGQPERVIVHADDTVFGAYEIDYSPLDLNIALADLQGDGMLDVVLSVVSGDLMFRGSTLVVEADRSIAAVPEPTSLAVFGLGLFAMGFARRAGKKRQ